MHIADAHRIFTNHAMRQLRVEGQVDGCKFLEEGEKKRKEEKEKGREGEGRRRSKEHNQQMVRCHAMPMFDPGFAVPGPLISATQCAAVRTQPGAMRLPGPL